MPNTTFKAGDRVIVYGLGEDVEGVYNRYWDGDIGTVLYTEDYENRVRVTFDDCDRTGYVVKNYEIKHLHQTQVELLFS